MKALFPDKCLECAIKCDIIDPEFCQNEFHVIKGEFAGSDPLPEIGPYKGHQFTVSFSDLPKWRWGPNPEGCGGPPYGSTWSFYIGFFTISYTRWDFSK